MLGKRNMNVLCTLIFSMLTQPKDPQIIRNCFVMFSNVNMPV